jgi:hypothetical protein
MVILDIDWDLGWAKLESCIRKSLISPWRKRSHGARRKTKSFYPPSYSDSMRNYITSITCRWCGQIHTGPCTVPEWYLNWWRKFPPHAANLSVTAFLKKYYSPSKKQEVDVGDMTPAVRRSMMGGAKR